MKNLSPES